MEPVPEQTEHLAFVYSNLPDPKSYIRLLKVVSAEEGSLVKCDLSTWPIASALSYNGISYTWDDEADTSSILVNGQRVRVRSNCEYVLRQASWNVPNEYIWIDALCIDQSNVPEKNAQVAMMGHIYATAKRVLACVGPAADDSEYFFRGLNQNRRSFSHVAGRLDRSRVDCFRLPSSYFLGWHVCLWLLRYPTKRLHKASDSFFGRTYFRRLWIAQEIFMANEIIVCCGASTVPFDSLAGHAGVMYYTSHTNHAANSGPYIEYGKYLFRRCINMLIRRRFTRPATGWTFYSEPVLALGMRGRENLMDLDDCIHVSFKFDCGDKRDKIYAILSMVDWRDGPSVYPDYSNSIFIIALETFDRLRYVNSWVFTNVVDLLQLDETNPDVQHRITALSSPESAIPARGCSVTYPNIRLEAWAQKIGTVTDDQGSEMQFGDFYVKTRWEGDPIQLPIGSAAIRPGDCVLQCRTAELYDEVCLVIAREQDEGRYDLIGCTDILGSGWKHIEPDFQVEISCNLEDLLMWAVLDQSVTDLIKAHPYDPSEQEQDKYKGEMKPLRARRFCRYKGSSYATRAPDLSCWKDWFGEPRGWRES